MANSEETSDDEIFFGKMSLKEVRKHIFMEEHQNLTWSLTNREDECNSSFKLIATHSEPNLLNDHNKILQDTDVNTSSITNHFQDYSNKEIDMLKDNCSEMENMLTNICRVTTESKDCVVMNKNLNVSSCSLNDNGPVSRFDDKIENLKDKAKQENDIECHYHTNANSNDGCNNWAKALSPKLHSPIKKENVFDEVTLKQESKKTNILQISPSNEVKVNVFKTPPRTPLPRKVDSSLKKGVYQHTSTPVPTYHISKFHQNCGEVQNFKESSSKKAYCSAIPISIKAGTSNKENLLIMANCSGKKDKGISKEKRELKNVLAKKSILPLPKAPAKQASNETQFIKTPKTKTGEKIA